MECVPVSVLLANDGKTCAQMTHVFKILGNGSMQEGIQRFYSHAECRGLLRGRLQGIAGMFCASVALYFVIDSWKTKQQLKHEEQAIQAAVKEISQLSEINSETSAHPEDKGIPEELLSTEYTKKSSDFQSFTN